MSNRCVVYCDLLGFKKAIHDNPQAANRQLRDYHSMLDDSLNDQRTIPEEIRQLPGVMDTLITSYETFIPFSDLFFIAASDANLLIRQLSNFLVRAFIHTSPQARDSDRFAIAAHGNREFTRDQLFEVDNVDRVMPLLFQGGIDFGSTTILDGNILHDGRRIQTPIIAGESVVGAYAFDRFGKGPRLFCTQRFVDQLDEQGRRFVIGTPKRVRVGNTFDPAFEILWPLAFFHEDNEWGDERNRLHELLPPALTLWNGYENTQFHEHYYMLVKLIIRSIRTFFQETDGRDEVIRIIRTNIQDAEMQGHLDDLMSDGYL